jgi:glycosyltransferase involved in cell wall biosynthesis
MTPKISVILPVYNAQSYLRESIDSILNQSFQDFELIMINDGSTDSSLSIMESYTDQRIRIINQTNAGLPVSLNRAIAQAQGQYLARQDADDICLPERLAKQFAYLDTHPQCALLGTWAQILVENVPTDRSLSHPHLNGEKGPSSFDEAKVNDIVNDPAGIRVEIHHPNLRGDGAIFRQGIGHAAIFSSATES